MPTHVVSAVVEVADATVGTIHVPVTEVNVPLVAT